MLKKTSSNFVCQQIASDQRKQLCGSPNRNQRRRSVSAASTTQGQDSMTLTEETAHTSITAATLHFVSTSCCGRRARLPWTALAAQRGRCHKNSLTNSVAAKAVSSPASQSMSQRQPCSAADRDVICRSSRPSFALRATQLCCQEMMAVVERLLSCAGAGILLHLRKRCCCSNKRQSYDFVRRGPIGRS